MSLAPLPLVLGSLLAASAFGAARDSVRVHLPAKAPAGRQEVVLLVYAASEGTAPMAAETRVIDVAAGGTIVPLGSLAFAAGAEESWLSVRIGSGPESRRVPLRRAGEAPPVTVHIVSNAAISANGIIESVSQGFRFPDGSVQTSAAQVSGGVPSVNGIGAAVTVVGSGTASVGTAGGTITVTGTGLTGVTPGNGLTGGGTSGSPTLSASYGLPVAIVTANAAGVSNDLARADHQHAHGNLAGGSLHAGASTGVAGFLSGADKAKLDRTVAYVRTVVVSPSAESEAASGTALLNALAGITGNGYTQQYLLKIEPGTYDLGTSELVMKEYVDIEGSGQNMTHIKTESYHGVRGINDADLRQLTITNRGSTADQWGATYYFNGFGTARLTDVTLNSVGTRAGAFIGIQLEGSASVILSRTTVSVSSANSNATGTGILSNGTGPVYIYDSRIIVSGLGTNNTNRGITNSYASLTMDSSSIFTGAGSQNTGMITPKGTITNSTIIAGAEAPSLRVAIIQLGLGTLEILGCRLLSSGTGGTAKSVTRNGGTVLIAFTMLGEPTLGTPTCFSVFDASYAATTCP